MGKRVKRNSASKFRIIDKNTIDGFGNDRRSGKDRRKISIKKYFLRGGLERRSWKDRRKIWYMTL